MFLRAGILVLWAAAASAAEGLSVETTRRGPAVEVRAYALVDAGYATVWGTLTDYDRLAEFIPGMKRSRIVERGGGTLVVEQSGETRFLFFVFPIEVTVLATAKPPHALDVRLLKGNLRRLEGGYRMQQPAPGRIALRWIGLVEPEALPPLLGELVIRASIRVQFEGMVREIERREAQMRGGPKADRR